MEQDRPTIIQSLESMPSNPKPNQLAYDMTTGKTMRFDIVSNDWVFHSDSCFEIKQSGNKIEHELEFVFDASGHPLRVDCDCGKAFRVEPQ